MPTVEHLSVSEYLYHDPRRNWKRCTARGQCSFGRGIKTHKEKLGSREATVYEYTLTIDGVVYRYRQYIAAYRSMMYSLTYTATAERISTNTLRNLADIVAAFAFR